MNNGISLGTKVFMILTYCTLDVTDNENIKYHLLPTLRPMYQYVTNYDSLNTRKSEILIILLQIHALQP